VEGSETVATEAPWHERMRAEVVRLGAEARAAKEVARALSPLTREAAFRDLKKLGTTAAKVAARLGDSVPPRAASMLQELEAWIREAPETARREVARALKARCDAEGIAMVVVSRDEPVKLRLPPLSVDLDFRTGRATIGFALQTIATCPATAPAVLDARREILRTWDEGFDAAQFHERCRRAWRACRAADERAEERVEILRFLPYLAVQMQSERFAVDPSPKTFRGYGRARFAYDVAKLRREKRLEQNGWRLNLGVATGGTAQEKKRVVYFEDGNGEGEYKLTVYFTRVETAS
jgi:hypothetical protein